MMGQIRKKKSNIEKKKIVVLERNKEGTNRNGQKPTAGLRKKIPNTNEEGINWKKKVMDQGKNRLDGQKKHMYDGNKEGTNSKKNSNIDWKKKLVTDEGNNKMDKKKY